MKPKIRKLLIEFLEICIAISIIVGILSLIARDFGVAIFITGIFLIAMIGYFTIIYIGETLIKLDIIPKKIKLIIKKFTESFIFFLCIMGGITGLIFGLISEDYSVAVIFVGIVLIGGIVFYIIGYIMENLIKLEKRDTVSKKIKLLIGFLKFILFISIPATIVGLILRSFVVGVIITVISFYAIVFVASTIKGNAFYLIYIGRFFEKFKQDRIAMDCYKLLGKIAKNRKSKMTQAVSHYLIGRIFNKNELFEEAEKELRVAVDMDPFWSYYYSLGWSLFDQGKYEEAEIALKEGVRLSPQACAYDLLGQALYRQNRLDDAENAYAEALKANWEYPYQTYLNLGNVFFRKKMYEEAEKQYEQAIALNPHFVNAYTNIATVYRAKLPLEEAINKIRNLEEKCKSVFKPKDENYVYFKWRIASTICVLYWENHLYSLAIENAINAEQISKEYEAFDVKNLIEIDEQVFSLLSKPDEKVLDKLPLLISNVRQIKNTIKIEDLKNALNLYCSCLELINNSLDIVRTKEPIIIDVDSFKNLENESTDIGFKVVNKLISEIKPLISEAKICSENMNGKTKLEKEQIANSFWEYFKTKKRGILELFDGVTLGDIASYRVEKNPNPYQSYPSQPTSIPSSIEIMVGISEILKIVKGTDRKIDTLDRKTDMILQELRSGFSSVRSDIENNFKENNDAMKTCLKGINTIENTLQNLIVNTSSMDEKTKKGINEISLAMLDILKKKDSDKLERLRKELIDKEDSLEREIKQVDDATRKTLRNCIDGLKKIPDKVGNAIKTVTDDIVYDVTLFTTAEELTKHIAPLISITALGSAGIPLGLATILVIRKILK